MFQKLKLKFILILFITYKLIFKTFKLTFKNFSQEMMRAMNKTYTHTDMKALAVLPEAVEKIITEMSLQLYYRRKYKLVVEQINQEIRYSIIDPTNSIRTNIRTQAITNYDHCIGEWDMETRGIFQDEILEVNTSNGSIDIMEQSINNRLFDILHNNIIQERQVNIYYNGNW